MFNIASVQAKNRFGTVIDTAQHKIVSVTRRGKIAAFVMSPEVLEDYIDGRLATEAEKNGFASVEETKNFLDSLRGV